MATKKMQMPVDGNGNALMTAWFNTSQDVDGTSASAQSAAIEGTVVYISAISADIRFLVGANPTALTNSPYLAKGSALPVPCKLGDKVAILGGTANIVTLGE